jgi:hypothetical protein
MTGQTGRLCWGYVPAGRLVDWSFDGDGHGGTVDARMLDRDVFVLGQAPLSVTLEIGPARWVAPAAVSTDDGDRVTLTIGRRVR